MVLIVFLSQGGEYLSFSTDLLFPLLISLQCIDAKQEEEARRQEEARRREEAKRREVVKRREEAKIQKEARRQEETKRQEEARAKQQWEEIQKQLTSFSFQASFEELNKTGKECIFQLARQVQGRTEPEIKQLVAEGNFPVGVWRKVHKGSSTAHQRMQQLNQELSNTSLELADIDQQIQALHAKKQELQRKFEQLQTEQAQSPAIPAKEIEKLSHLEEQLEQSFLQSVKNPDWSVVTMRSDDVSLVLGSCGLLSLRDSIMQANLTPGELDIAIEEKSYAEHNVQGDYLAFRSLEFVWDLLQAHQYPPDGHLKRCPVCRGNRDDVLKEWNLTLDFSAHPNISVFQLLYASLTDLIKIFKLSVQDSRTKFKEMKSAHNDFIASNQP
jgi:uncharacterized protein YlxW (UPF0749 family)